MHLQELLPGLLGPADIGILWQIEVGHQGIIVHATTSHGNETRLGLRSGTTPRLVQSGLRDGPHPAVERGKSSSSSPAAPERGTKTLYLALMSQCRRELRWTLCIGIR